MSDNTHAAMCVYCGETIIYDTRKVTDMAAAHSQIVEHDQQCPKNPMVDRLAFLNQQNTTLQEQRDEYRNHLAAIAEMTGNAGDIGATHEGVNALAGELARHKRLFAATCQQLCSIQQALGSTVVGIEPALVRELVEERDALAAHVERIISEWNSGDDQFSDEWIDRMGDIVEDAPETSLARRDALKQAEGAEIMRDELLKATKAIFHPHVAGVCSVVTERLNRSVEGHQ